MFQYERNGPRMKNVFGWLRLAKAFGCVPEQELQKWEAAAGHPVSTKQQQQRVHVASQQRLPDGRRLK